MLLEDIKKRWKFEGHVVSDCGAIQDIYEYHKFVKQQKKQQQSQ